MAVAGQSKPTRTWDPQTGKWAFAGNISVARSFRNMIMLPLNNDPFEKGQILVCGGSNTSSENATAIVELLTPNPSTNHTIITIKTIASSNFARMHALNAYLPGGKIIIFFGGCTFQNQLSTSHYNAEIFDPVSKSWTVVSGMNVQRIYHSTAIYF